MLHSLSVKSRDNARTPMQWDDTSQAGFTQGIPWLPVNPNYVTINAAAAVADPDSVFHHYRRLIALRHEHAGRASRAASPCCCPTTSSSGPSPGRWESRCCWCVANCSSLPADGARGALPDLTGARLLLATHGARPGRRWRRGSPASTWWAEACPCPRSSERLRAAVDAVVPAGHDPRGLPSASRSSWCRRPWTPDGWRRRVGPVLDAAATWACGERGGTGGLRPA